MEVTLKFNLPEENSEFASSIKGSQWYRVSKELSEWLRSKIKYQDKSEFEEVHQELYNIMECHNVNFEEVE